MDGHGDEGHARRGLRRLIDDGHGRRAVQDTLTYERLDQSLLPPLGEGDWLTAAQIRERCADPWAASLIDDWLPDAFARGLLHARRSPSRMDSTEYRLTRRGRRAR